MTKFLLDTWAWIEYFEGSEIGKKVDEKIKSENEIYTSVVSLAELSDNFHRKDAITGYSWEEVREFVETKTEILPVTPEDASNSGKTKTIQREEMSDFGLMDAIILETARRNDATLLSGDPHLQKQEISLETK